MKKIMYIFEFLYILLECKLMTVHYTPIILEKR